MEATLQKTKTQFVTDLYDAFKRGDIPFILDHLSESIEWTVVGGGYIPYGGTYHGKDGVMDFFKKLSETVDVTEFEYNTFVESDDWVIARGFYSFKAHSTGKEASSNWVMSWKFENGLPVMFDDFFDSVQVYKALY